MALHFSPEEFAARRAKVEAEMAERGLDALLVFAQESMYWLTGFDSFGFCFFQCLVVRRDGKHVLVTRAPDLRQAQHTSNIADIRVWSDRGSANPVDSLKDVLHELDLLGETLGVEYNTHGLTAHNGRLLDTGLASFAKLTDASDLIPTLRTIKSPAEVTYAREAARLADNAYEAGLAEIREGGDEGRILAAMQSAVFVGGGDYSGNEFIIGSGPDALLCRSKSGRRSLSASDQITLEFAGAYRRYHAALMRTVIIGDPTDRHLELHEAAVAALAEVEGAMRPGNTFGDVFEAHARVFDQRGLAAHRLNACGYSLGARYAPSWMDAPMFYRDNKTPIEPNMTLFTHMILADSDSGTAMTLGRTYLTGEGAPEPLSRLDLDLTVR
ncbi:MAG: Xaa-Pro dipeptidase [Hyphomicrobiales bacterium]|nr:MAG: Xaa-Pro dipeptidase [Hyphomicrobiales bacterium]